MHAVADAVDRQFLADKAVVGHAGHVDEKTLILRAIPGIANQAGILQDCVELLQPFQAMSGVGRDAVLPRPVVACTGRQQRVVYFGGRDQCLAEDAVGNFVVGAVATNAEDVPASLQEGFFDQLYCVAAPLGKVHGIGNAEFLEQALRLGPAALHSPPARNGVGDDVPKGLGVRRLHVVANVTGIWKGWDGPQYLPVLHDKPCST